MTVRKQTACVVMHGDAERDLVVGALEGLGLAVTAAEEPYEALGLFAEHPTNLLVLSLEGLVLSDCRFLKQLRRFSPPVRVLVLVPEGRRRDAVAFLEAGADAILPQTFLLAEFRLIVSAMLRPEAADPLTGLPNRPAYDKALPREIMRAARQGTSVALAIYDIDRFGKVNADLGYSQADEVLVEVAQRLGAQFRTYDMLARWGGEEFVVLLGALPGNEAKAREQACLVLERARKEVGETPVRLAGGTKRTVSISTGFALFPYDVPEFKRAKGKYLDTDECIQAGRALFDLANDGLKIVKETTRNAIRCPKSPTCDCPLRAEGA